MFRCFAVLLTLVLGLQSAPDASAQEASGCQVAATQTAVKGNDLCLAVKTYGAVGQPDRTLVVMLHGDLSNGGPADYTGEPMK